VASTSPHTPGVG